ncbi:MAG: hypothetical protein KAW17_09645 [Candidatus Eisenbacteria sp.]|nr:hypothetical protein [Candidatus Eisenbacteria bacterium]
MTQTKDRWLTCVDCGVRVPPGTGLLMAGGFYCALCTKGWWLYACGACGRYLTIEMFEYSREASGFKPEICCPHCGCIWGEHLDKRPFPDYPTADEVIAMTATLVRRAKSDRMRGFTTEEISGGCSIESHVAPEKAKGVSNNCEDTEEAGR